MKRVALVGDFRSSLDEGMRNINEKLREYLGCHADVHSIHPHTLAHPRAWIQLHRFRPNVILYLQGPTIRSFVLCRLARALVPSSRVGIVAVNSRISPQLEPAIRLLRPHFALAATRHEQQRLRRLGVAAHLVIPGVDQERFSPVARSVRPHLRRELSLPLFRKIVLHVGHLTQARGGLTLAKAQELLGASALVVVVCSKTNAADLSVQSKVEAAGGKIVDDFQPHIERFYRAADHYLFCGTRADAAIDVPLSVLEALASGIPVTTTRFGGLPEMFRDSQAVAFADDEDSLLALLRQRLRNEPPDPSACRAAVDPYTWDAFGDQVLAACTCRDRALAR